MRPSPLPLAVALASATAVTLVSQFQYQSGIDLVGLTVSVVSREGGPVTDLQADDFEVREDGVLQNVSYFSAGSDDKAVPLHIGLLFDTSESMEKDLSFSRSAAIRFLNTFPKALDFTLVDFDTEVRAARFSQEEFPNLVARIRNRQAKGFTALYDALSVYLGGAFDQTGRKVLVIYTDGGDTSSSRTWAETIRILRASDVTVYPIGFMANRGPARLIQQERLSEIASLTGGLALFPRVMKDLEGMYSRIGDEIQRQYMLGYVSSNAAKNGAWRRIDVRVRRPASSRLQVRARQGYFAPTSSKAR